MPEPVNNDYPRALYKKGEKGANRQEIWGLGHFDVLHAADKAEVDAALADGWTLRPDEEPAPKKAAKPAAA